MSNIGTKIEKLVSDGFSYNTLRGLNESQINLLYSRLVEQPTNPNLQKNLDGLNALDLKLSGIEQKMKKLGLAEESPLEKDAEQSYTGQEGPHDEDDMAPDGMGESEIKEKFESKAQQRLFWAKCDNARTEKSKKKWCKWAKEYSDKTDFKKLPEKKLEESLTKLVEKYIPESISKKELMSLIESSTRTKEAPGEKTKEKEAPSKPKRKNPFKIEPAQKPGPKAELDEAGAPAKAPVKTPTKTPSKPQRKNPFKIEPAQKPGPKARRKGPEWLSYNSFINAGYRLK